MTGALQSTETTCGAGAAAGAAAIIFAGPGVRMWQESAGPFRYILFLYSQNLFFFILHVFRSKLLSLPHSDATPPPLERQTQTPLPSDKPHHRGVIHKSVECIFFNGQS